MGALVRCASLTMCTICESIVSAPMRSARNTNVPVPFTVPPVTLAPGYFRLGSARPEIIGLVNGTLAFQNLAVHGDFLARTHPNALPDGDALDRNVYFASILFDDPRYLRGKAQQSLDGAGCVAARAQLQNLHREAREW